MNYAIIANDYTVINTVLWDGVSQWTPQEEHILVVELPEGFGIGDTYNPDTEQFVKTVGIAST